ncbi:unnamed protein product [Schistosoma guineensis]|nr:unnamed protein product [Schistosoma bovis]CAH8607400.1 unnamed protein product [Schistosoma guineensis]CAH8612313.1 unnamed protein product [Schistosoma curassoni]
MDQSLDDIIQQKRIRVTRGRGRGRGRGGESLRGVRRGGIARRNTNGMSRALPDKWQHDMFQDGRSPKGSGNTVGNAARLHISNLDFGVNNDDINELFREFGAIRKATVHYDRSGRSLGTAEVVFVNPLSATKAKNHYNGVPLDGRPMVIQLVGAAVETTVTSRPRVTRPRGSPIRRGFGRGRGRARGRGRIQKPTVTKEELDAQLAAYNAQRA